MTLGVKFQEAEKLHIPSFTTSPQTTHRAGSQISLTGINTHGYKHYLTLSHISVLAGLGRSGGKLRVWWRAVMSISLSGYVMSAWCSVFKGRSLFSLFSEEIHSLIYVVSNSKHWKYFLN